MSKLFLLFFVIISFSCNESNNTYKPLSSGRIHSVSVVINSNDWNSKIGDAIRKSYADEYLGLPQIEERFSLSHIDYETFSGFARTSRNIIYINKRKTKSYSIAKNKFARPQLYLEISGTNEDEIIEQIILSKRDGIKAFTNGEIIENKRRILQSPLMKTELQNKYNIELTMSSAYKLFKNENNVMWFQKPTKYGTSNVVVFEKNYKEDIDLNDALQIRDSLSKAFIPGRLENSYMITEQAYLPVFSKTKIGKFDAYETRGTWEVKGDYMGGPFLNYIVKDTANNRMIFLDGFVFSPSQRKRDNIIELQSIISSLKIYNKE